MSLALRFAFRDLRGGLRAFRIFLACLALGVAAVAAVGSVRLAIEQGLRAEGQVILGGDAEITATYRRATEAEAAWMAEASRAVSEVVDFRSMAVATGPDGATERALTQVKGVDGLYPLAGAVTLEPRMPLADALAPRDGRHGLVMEQALADRLGIAPGATVRLGLGEFELRAILGHEPDRASAGFGLGPRSLVSAEGLANTGLIAPGTLYETRYRLSLPEGTDLAALQSSFEAAFPDAGLRWRDRRRAAPGVERFVERIAAFLVLVGLAALAVGGVGIASAVRSYLDGKTETIATLKTLGATGGTIFAIFLLQVAALTALGVALGLLIGVGGPILAGPLIAAALPVPAEFGLYPRPLFEGALYGGLTAFVFALWPLARARDTRAQALFRDLGGGPRWPRARYLLALLGLVFALLLAAVWLSGAPQLAIWFMAGILAALALLSLLGLGLARLAALAARLRIVRGRPALRLALASLGGPQGGTVAAVLALGLGLTVLAAIGQVDANLRSAFAEELPERSPAFFLVDIQNHQRDAVLETLDGTGGVERVETAPMLRGVVTKLAGMPAREAEIDPEGAWILRGDRGVSYAALQPGPLVAGNWWPEDYAGPPLVSFSAEHAAELRVGIGDTISVNVLGREITAEIANLRDVQFRDLGINFLMVFDPGSFAGAPHTHIATVYAAPEQEGAILRAVSDGFPNVTAIGVREAISRVSDALDDLSAAARWAAGATLATGLVVLIGAAAAGEGRRRYEAAILKVLGATRGRILWSFALRSGLTGLASGAVAVALGAAAAWVVVVFVLDAAFVFEPVSAIAIVAGGALTTLVAGLVFALRALGVRPARVLRAAD